jgi:hypothetical protein
MSTNGLYPTKTRKQLLQDIHGGHVTDQPGGCRGDDEIPTRNDASGRWVTAAVTEVCRAGWATLDQDGRTWQLTPDGRAVLGLSAEAAP